jgi:hypothetical protein
MLKLLRLAVLLGMVAGLLFLVPLGGRTLFDRWRSASDASDFVARTWAELRGVESTTSPGASAGTKKGRPGKPPPAAASPSAPDQPLDSTTDADRKALDKLLDQQLTEKPSR